MDVKTSLYSDLFTRQYQLVMIYIIFGCGQPPFAYLLYAVYALYHYCSSYDVCTLLKQARGTIEVLQGLLQEALAGHDDNCHNIDATLKDLSVNALTYEEF